MLILNLTIHHLWGRVDLYVSKTNVHPKDISQDVVFDEAHNIINGSPSLSHLRAMCTVMVNKQSCKLSWGKNHDMVR